MARNKHPEETVEKILSVSLKLFMEKGYDHTTIQDIVDALGMSKGAVYHHFKSKEDIFDRICDQYYDSKDWMRDATRFPGETALEKMRGLFAFLLSDPAKLDLDRISGSIVLNPKLVLLALQSTIRDAAPVVEALIREGNADGSLHVKQPRETAEAFMLLMNMWVGTFVGDRENFIGKMTFLKSFSDALGLPLIDDRIMSVALDYYDSIMANLAIL